MAAHMQLSKCNPHRAEPHLAVHKLVHGNTDKVLPGKHALKCCHGRQEAQPPAEAPRQDCARRWVRLGGGCWPGGQVELLRCLLQPLPHLHQAILQESRVLLQACVGVVETAPCPISLIGSTQLPDGNSVAIRTSPECSEAAQQVTALWLPRHSLIKGDTAAVCAILRWATNASTQTRPVALQQDKGYRAPAACLHL